MAKITHHTHHGVEAFGGWKVHTVHLLEEVTKNKGAEILVSPIRIFGGLLHDVAERASQINDPALNILMLRLTLYEKGDLDKNSVDDVRAAYEGQEARKGNGPLEQIKALQEALAGMISIEESVTMGQERELRAEWLPKAKAALALSKDA